MVHILFHLIFTNHKIPVKKVENSSLINLETVLEIKVMPAYVASVVSQLFVTLWTIAHQAPLSLGFPSKNTGVGCHFFLKGSSRPIDGTRVSCISCTGR